MVWTSCVSLSLGFTVAYAYVFMTQIYKVCLLNYLYINVALSNGQQTFPIFCLPYLQLDFFFIMCLYKKSPSAQMCVWVIKYWLNSRNEKESNTVHLILMWCRFKLLIPGRNCFSHIFYANIWSWAIFLYTMYNFQDCWTQSYFL